MSTQCPNCSTENPDTDKFCGECGTQLSSIDSAQVSFTKTLETPRNGIIPGMTFAARYKVIEELGRGGMGVVYKAEDIKLKRTVAIKLLPPGLTGDKKARERFIREAQSAAVLDHPNICTIYEVDEADEKTFISMAYVDGQNLREKVKPGPLALNEGLDLAIQAAEGLSAAHKKGIVHRDIKSSNIMVTKQGQAKIMDFGLAKSAGASLITREGVTMGTVAYMSPEQAQGKTIDHRSDIWSLGVVLYEIFGGKLPFKGDTEASFLYSIVHEDPVPLNEINPDVPIEIQKVINRALKKKPSSRYSSAAEMGKILRDYLDSLEGQKSGIFDFQSFLKLIKRPSVAVPAVLIAATICLAAFIHIKHKEKVRWAREEALLEIERIIKNDWPNYFQAFALAQKAEAIIPEDTKLQELLSECSVKISLETDPPGASVFWKEYTEPDGEWNPLGTTPLDNIQLAVGHYRWKMEKEGYETVYAASPSFATRLAVNNFRIPNNLKRILDKQGDIPAGMVRIPGREETFGTIQDFYIDQYEVTNKEFKIFVDDGGYQNEELWKYEFIKDGRSLTWEEAMAEFKDQTGRHGPSTWLAGDFPEGQENFPVSGVSWYEAAAYAEFVGKNLPTDIHWGLARRLFSNSGFNTFLMPMCNIDSEGPVEVGSLKGMTQYGAFDLHGNVREWCWNESMIGRVIRGGAWNDAIYMVGGRSQSAAFDRSAKNGFRCVQYLDPVTIPPEVFEAIEYTAIRNFYEETPVQDSIFQIYLKQFDYDQTDLNAKVEYRDESSKDWIMEKISIDAAYGNERIPVYLALPKNTSPPYQTVIYFPGSGAVWQDHVGNMNEYGAFKNQLTHFVKDGRAVLFPIYKGTFERREDQLSSIHMGRPIVLYTEMLTQMVKDLRRSIDYLETRSEIDAEKLAYLGFSWGGVLGAIIPAVENRLKVSILNAGGLYRSQPREEVDPVNYVTRIKTPTLMLHGKYDRNVFYEQEALPMFDLLGTPDENKKLIPYPTDHIVPYYEYVKESLNWLDKYFGPVKRR